MQVRTFILRLGSRAKFFEVTVEGRAVEIAEGPVGSDGQVWKYDFTTVNEARQFVEEAIGEKIRKGFVEQEEPLPAATQAQARDPELEEAIARDLRDVQARLVYADWLQSKGDPRGDLIVLQHRIYEEGTTPALAEAVSEIIAAHRAHFFGDLALFGDYLQLDWFMGFIQRARIGWNAASLDAECSIQSLVHDLLTHPSGRFLEELEVGTLVGDHHEMCFDDITAIALETGPHPHVRRVSLGDPAITNYRVTWISNAAELFHGLPNLTSLELGLGRVSFKDARMVPLTELVWKHPELDQTALGPLLDRTFPKLTRLELGVEPSYGAIYLEEAGAAFQPECLPALKHLLIDQWIGAPALLRSLESSGLLAQLESLTLTRTAIGSDELSDMAPALAHLQPLVLDEQTVDDVVAWRERIPGLEVVRSPGAEESYQRAEEYADPENERFDVIVE